MPQYFLQSGLNGFGQSTRLFFDKPFGRHCGVSTGININYIQVSGSAIYYSVNFPNNSHGGLTSFRTTDIAFGLPVYATWNFSPNRKWSCSVFGGTNLISFTTAKSDLTFYDGYQSTVKGNKLNFVWKYNNAYIPSDELGFDFSRAFRKVYSIGFGLGISPSFLIRQYFELKNAANPGYQFPMQFHIKVGRIVKKMK